MKKNIAPYKDENIILRLLEWEDLDDTLAWRNEPKHRIWFNSTQEIAKEDHYAWFKQVYLAKENDFIFIVTNPENHRLGQVAIYQIDFEKQTAQFGRFLVNPAYAGKGMMIQATKAAIQLAKQVWGIRKLTLEVKVHNVKAIHIYQKCGFVTQTQDQQSMYLTHALA